MMMHAARYRTPLLCLLVFSQLNLALALADSPPAESPGHMMSSQQAIESSLPPEQEDTLFQQIKDLSWQEQSPEVKRINLRDVLKQTEKNNFEIQLSREKINETEVKQQDVEAKRLLFFFKYFDSAYLEGSAESDVMAASAHAKVVLNESLLESLQKYYALMQTLLNKYITFQAIEQGKSQLSVNQNRFNSGESTSFDLMQTKTQLVKRYQDYLQSDITYKNASLALGDQLSLPREGLFYPQDLTFQNHEFSVSVFHLFPAKLGTEEAMQVALQQRPELKELKFRRVSLENLVKASSIKFDRTQAKILQSTLKQLDLRQQKTEQGIQAMVRKAYEEYHFAQQKITLASQQLALAAKGLKQAQVSHQSGFSSNKDVLDAQVAYAQAQVNYANTLIDYNLSQVQLLFEMGLINVDTLLEGVVQL